MTTTKTKTAKPAPAVPDSMKAELDAVTPVEDVTPVAPVDVEAIALIDPDKIVIPDAFTSDEDKAYLKDRGIEILNIGRKADAAIKQIVAQIKGRATLEIGKKLCEIYDHFNDRNLDGLPGWRNYVESCGVNYRSAQVYISAARAVDTYNFLFGDDYDPAAIYQIADGALSKLTRSLPSERALEIMYDVANGGSVPTEKELTKEANKPEVKLTKKQEDLQAAKEKLAQRKQKYEEVKADPAILPTDAEYIEAVQLVKNLKFSVTRQEAQIEKMKAEIAESKAREARLQEERAAMEAELEAMKFDDAAAREQRVKRISHTLPNLIPQALADLQRYIAEKVHYEPEVQKGIDDQVKTFISYCKEHYD